MKFEDIALTMKMAKVTYMLNPFVYLYTSYKCMICIVKYSHSINLLITFLRFV